jgi:hypothetical protein
MICFHLRGSAGEGLDQLFLDANSTILIDHSGAEYLLFVLWLLSVRTRASDRRISSFEPSVAAATCIKI